MSAAITQIVDGYVKLQDRRALEALQVHRRKLIITMQSLRGPFDAGKPIRQNQNELAIIEAGLVRLGERGILDI